MGALPEADVKSAVKAAQATVRRIRCFFRVDQFSGSSMSSVGWGRRTVYLLMKGQCKFIVPETASPHMSIFSKAESSSLRPIDVQEDPGFGSGFRWTCINPVQPLVMVHVWFIHDTWVVVREYDDGSDLCKSMRTVSDQGIGLTVCSYTIASGPARQCRAKSSPFFRNPESGAPWGNMGPLSSTGD